MKTTNINIRVPVAIKQELTSFAESKGKDLSSFIMEEIFIQLRGHFVKCPKCEKPCFDEREMHITGTATAKCQWCGNEFEHEF
jgi:hypothetical protein